MVLPGGGHGEPSGAAKKVLAARLDSSDVVVVALLPGAARIHGEEEIAHAGHDQATPVVWIDGEVEATKTPFVAPAKLGVLDPGGDPVTSVDGTLPRLPEIDGPPELTTPIGVKHLGLVGRHVDGRSASGRVAAEHVLGPGLAQIVKR